MAYLLEISFSNKATTYFNNYERVFILSKILFEKNFLKKTCKNILKISKSFADKSKKIRKLL